MSFPLLNEVHFSALISDYIHLIIWSVCTNDEFCANMLVVNDCWLLSIEVTIFHYQDATKLLGGLCRVLADDSLITSIASNIHGQHMGRNGSSLYKQQQCYLTTKPFRIQRMGTSCSKSVLCQMHFAERRLKAAPTYSPVALCLKLWKIWAGWTPDLLSSLQTIPPAISRALVLCM